MLRVQNRAWSVAFQHQQSIIFSEPQTKRGGKQGQDKDGSVANGSRSWTLQFRNGQKQRKRKRMRVRQGRESPECKVMFSRNVRPPVLSCNLTGNSPGSCLTGGPESQREGGKEGGEKMDLVRRRWVEDKEGCTSNHCTFFNFS